MDGEADRRQRLHILQAAFLAAAWNDSVIDRIGGPILDPWFEGTGLSPEILFEYLGAGTTVGHLLVPVETESGTVIVEMRGFTYEMADWLPTFLAFIESLRVDGAAAAAAGASAAQPESAVAADQADSAKQMPVTEAEVAAFQESCAGGDAQGCFDLANAYNAGKGVAQDKAKAAELHQQAWDGGHAKGCVYAGAVYSLGDRQDLSKAEALLLQGCELGDPEGCTHVAQMYALGRDVEKDHAKAVSLLRKACDLGMGDSCRDLGELQNDDVGQTIAQTVSRNMDNGLLLIDRLKGNDADASSGIAPGDGSLTFREPDDGERYL